MVFVVAVYWTIKEGCEEEFEKFWRECLPVKDKSVLVGEFLSRIAMPDGYNSWDLTTDDATTFVNVGIWNSKEDFIREIGQYISKRRGFEKKFRVRAMLTPIVWRLGESELKNLKDERTVS